ncbi:MAG: GC-type dockerin domain-anchored protein [Phycisphaerales bacterium JB052]
MSSTALAGDNGCVADFNGDGELDFFDVSEFLVGFNNQEPVSDLSGDGLYNFFDVSIFLTSFASDCASVDTDEDGIPDFAETNDGIFFNENATGTDPLNPDTDGDGINDGDEVFGTVDGLDLPAMGANPLRRDIFVEIDWYTGTVEGEFRDFKPTENGIQRIIDCYANAPVENPYGAEPGIDIHIDYGQGGVFTNGQQLPGDPPLFMTFDGDFNVVKTFFFDANRKGYFHYAIFANRHSAAENGSSGIAEINGDDFMVTLNGFNSEYNMSQTFVHEIGHNLGLRHGGFEDTNWKPNYNSVMNYRHQFPGADTDGDAFGDGLLDYSSGFNFDIDENDVNEINGVMGVGVDFNGNGILDVFNYPANLNCSAVFANPCGVSEGCYDGFCEVLKDSDDWSNINWNRLNESADRNPEPVEIVDCDNAPTTK